MTTIKVKTSEKEKSRARDVLLDLVQQLEDQFGRHFSYAEIHFERMDNVYVDHATLEEDYEAYCEHSQKLKKLLVKKHWTRTRHVQFKKLDAMGALLDSYMNNFESDYVLAVTGGGDECEEATHDRRFKIESAKMLARCTRKLESQVDKAYDALYAHLDID